MRTKNGSALIFVLATTAFILTVLAALLTMSVSSVNNINKYNKINSAYYAGESGIQRIMCLFNQYSIGKDFNTINIENCINNSVVNVNEVIPKLDNIMQQYTNGIKQNCQSFGGENGIDKIKFNNFINESSYYSVKTLDVDKNKSSCNCYDDKGKSVLTYKSPIKLEVIGYVSEGSKTFSRIVSYNFDIVINYFVDKQNKKLIIDSLEFKYYDYIKN